MVDAIMDGFISMLQQLISILTFPIDLAIDTIAPDASNLFATVSGFIQQLDKTIQVMASWSCVPSEVFVTFVGFVMASTALSAAWAITGAFKWVKVVKFW